MTMLVMLVYYITFSDFFFMTRFSEQVPADVHAGLASGHVKLRTRARPGGSAFPQGELADSVVGHRGGAGGE